MPEPARIPGQSGGSFRQEHSVALPGSSPCPSSEKEPTPMMSATPDHAETGWLVRLAESADLQHRVGTCQQPITVTGHVVLVERDTGRILDDPDTPAPGNRVALRCRSRRASVCPPCAALYKLDAYHLIAAGLHGGKDTPTGVVVRPRLFVTLTAPSFGPVHLGPDKHGQPRACHPRARRASARRGCGRWHPVGDPLIGTPLDTAGYDYAGQVLFNAYAGRLWARFVQQSRRALATTAGLPRDIAASQVRMVFAKVAEFQARGVVHLHAVVRLDGPDGPGSPPPLWATVTVFGAGAACRRRGGLDQRSWRSPGRNPVVAVGPAARHPADRRRRWPVGGRGGPLRGQVRHKGGGGRGNRSRPDLLPGLRRPRRRLRCPAVGGVVSSLRGHRTSVRRRPTGAGRSCPTARRDVLVARRATRVRRAAAASSRAHVRVPGPLRHHVTGLLHHLRRAARRTSPLDSRAAGGRARP